MTTERFILSSNLVAIIADYKFYADHELEIDNWLYEYNCQREGMVIKFCNEKIKMMFIIRWAA